MKKLLLIITLILLSSSFLIGCAGNCLVHDYQIESYVEATCTEQGSIIYQCTKCGDEYTETIEAKGHNPGPEATTTSPQICLDCGVVLQEKVLPSPVTATHSLAINHYAGTATSYCTTTIDTQIHSKYILPTQRYFDSDPTSQAAKPLDLDVSIPIQEFYTHEILSVYKLGTEDGKTFTTPGGFKINFNVETIESKAVTDLNAAVYSDFLDNYDTPSALKIVRLYQSSASYGGVFEVVDFANSYIEIEKDGDSENARKISLWDETKNAVKNEIEITDLNGRLFDDESTYRVLFKYSIAWVTNPTSAVYDEDGYACYPYGLINDQYDYFYVKITNEKDGVLVPDDFGTTDELFYQLRVDNVTMDDGELFLASKATINFGDQIKIYVDTILDCVDSEHYFKGMKLEKFNMTLYRYDYDSDTGLEGTDPYIFYEEYELLSLMENEDTFELALKKDPQLRNRPCKMIVESEFLDESTLQVVALKQTYIFTFDWE